ncbi:elongation factor P--(R)-beta-lysine ligase [Thalassotalea piscium]|uniref:Lysyl-tRNA synthetase class 2 n=1 Tax=Thalassotalea piscium TaxID=1230533 RepID=A0A7X0NJP0_9GAMM|nr:elongation factor P--(R)-beta-lysine ligase [Thalassotalea piscium]MBB6544692.1 lysyl-tRNA synthetase class 2 [Thalassotalea piscium]
MSVPLLTWEVAKQRAEFIQEIRMFFYQRNVIEVETPLLSNGTVTDVHLDVFDTAYEHFPDTPIHEHRLLYLQTSPEFAMKRLLAHGYGSIFQICKAFRKEAYGAFHNPEFTMLEWYRVGFSYNELIAEVSDLLTTLLACEQPEIKSYQNAFLEATTIDPLQCSIEQLQRFLALRGVNDDWISQETEKDTLLQYVFSEYVETIIGKVVPCVIVDFPKTQAALACVSESDPRVAHRFECYFKGVELANGYEELTDPEEQLNRFHRDNETRKRLGKALKPIDNNLIEAMEKGLPKCSGIALGVDRLLMIALGKNTISEVITFNIERA